MADADTPQPPSKDQLKAAFKAFRKRLKLTRLEADSKISNSPLTGRRTEIVAIMPPHEYPEEVWKELAKQGKIKYAGQGLYELVEE